MEIILEKDFRDEARKLSPHLQEKLADLLAALAKDPFHPSLHTKRLVGPLAGSFSFRVARDWRVLFYFSSPSIIRIITLGHRKDIYR